MSDASEDVATAARVVLEVLGAAGFRPSILHVLTEDNQPRMWDGSGHNADQWFDEMRRRHGAGPETMTVVTGDPEHELVTFAAGADLVIMLWNHDASSGRAPLLRSMLRRGIAVPHLLVPLAWVATLPRVGRELMTTGLAPTEPGEPGRTPPDDAAHRPSDT